MKKKRAHHRSESESPDPEPVRGGAEEEPGPEDPDSDHPQDEQTGRLQELEAECARLTEERLRGEAELVNYRRRAIRDREEAETRAKEQVLSSET